MSEQTKKDIVLIAPGPRRIQIGAMFHLPLPLLCLAAWIRQDEKYNGRIKILDMQIKDLTIEDFKNAVIVGITTMTGQQIKYGLVAAKMAREANKDIVIVWGGIHPSLLPEQTIDHELVDVVVIGEGEDTFREVVDSVSIGGKIANIPGTCVKTENGEIIIGEQRPFLDLDSLPIPAYDLVNIEDYHGIEHQFDYQSSRGCPFRCGFCYNTVFCGSKWRSKSAGKVIEELKFIAEKYGVKNFAMNDDEFFINIKRAERIFDGIIEQNLNFGMIVSCRLDIIQRFSDEMLAKIRKAGLIQMFFGAESGSNETLKNIMKDIITEDIIEGALKTARAGIRPILSFMSGFPGETIEQYTETLDIISKVLKAHPLITVNGIFPFNAYPGTVLSNKAKKLGLKTPDSLDEWGNWSFQYEPLNPWIEKKMKKWMQIAFYIVRFKYYIVRIQDRYHNNWKVILLQFALFPLSVSAKIRYKRKWFSFAWEWKFFAYAVRKTFGYL